MDAALFHCPPAHVALGKLGPLVASRPPFSRALPAHFLRLWASQRRPALPCRGGSARCMTARRAQGDSSLFSVSDISRLGPSPPGARAARSVLRA